MTVNIDNPDIYIVMTDEDQILYVTNDAEDAYEIQDKWNSAHAAESIIIECTWVDGKPGWKPMLPPNADITW